MVVLSSSDAEYPAVFTISATDYPDVVVRVEKKGAATAAVVENQSETTYTVTVAENIAYGTVTVDPTSAKAGATVTVTATPAKGYELDMITVTGESGTSVEVNDGQFTMPAENVTVSATFKVVQVTPPTGEGKEIALSQVKLSQDFFGQDWYVTFGEETHNYVSAISKITVNGVPWNPNDDYNPSSGGAYRADCSNDRLVFAAKDFSSNPTIPVLKSGDVITITATGYKDLTMKFVVDAEGNASLVADDGQGDPYELHVKIEGSFEAAIVGQKDYDGVSSASTGGASSNKNSAVTVYGALVKKDAKPTDADWEKLESYSSKINLVGSKCEVNIDPDTEKGTPADSDSGMEGVYMTISSDLTLNGTPKDAGSYLISIHVEDNQGRAADSNALPFRIYTGEETLAEQIKVENLKQYESGLYAWDIMEPWTIKNFGSNVEGEETSVRVPEKLEVWYGSHQSGTYGYLGYDLAWDKVLAGEIPQTLYIPAGCNLTLVNMEILSSVRIVVESGGKLTLSDSVVQGIIDVENSGTFSMNYDAYNQEFTTGASVCGQIRLADGAILENAAIYSHANYLANGDLTDRTTYEPVVTTTGNVTFKGQVFISGDAGGRDYGQTGLRVKGTLTLEDNAVLAVYGGKGDVVNTKGGTAIELNDGTITGSGKVIAIGGKVLWEKGGDAVTGTGTISTSEAFLQGATASEAWDAEPGKAISGNVKLTSASQYVQNGTVKETTANDPLADLYWKTGIDAVPPLDKFVTKEVPNGPEVTGHQVTVAGSYADVTGAGEYAEGAEVSIFAGSRSGYTFNGWMTDSDDVIFADKNGAETTFIMPNHAVTVTAGWTKNNSSSGSHSSGGSSSSSSGSYTVSVPAAKNGDMTVSPKNASKGDTVTITVTPDKGYELDTITVKDANGNTIKLTDKGNGEYTFTMPGSKVTVSAEFVEEQVTSTFTDVPADAYYADAVAWAVKNGITNGKASGLFGSNDPCTRGQIVTFLWRTVGSPAPKGAAAVPTDVLPGSYCYDAVAWAIENGITNGLTDGTFGVNNPCTRGQSVTLLYRALGKAPTMVNGFTDVAADAFCVDAVAWAVENGVTNGTSATTFSPNNGCTRAQIVTFLYRAYQGK